MKVRIVFFVALALAGGVAGSASAAPKAADCQARANDTKAKLEECITEHDLWQHLSHFQTIADANPSAQGHPNRNTGTSGYRASAEYVARLMRHAGYRVTVQSYPWERFEVVGAPSFRLNGLAVAAADWSVARLSGSGHVATRVQPIGSAGEPLSQTGCAATDFRGFVRGRAALLRRGNCDFDTQVVNAEAAGAAAVILYNTRGDAALGASGKAHDDGTAVPAPLVHPATIPVIGAASHAFGADLAARAWAGQPADIRIAVRAPHKSDVDYNVIADSPYGDPRRVVVADAHLDSIYGAGILDNASGSVTILEIALNLAHTPTRNRLRYIWFGGEEIGLLGSRYYTHTLPPDALRKIAFDIDVDVTATPNFDVLIADPGHARDADKFPPNVVPESRVGNAAFTRAFHAAGIVSRLAWFGNDGTDSNSFSRVGVPNSGILTQQDCCKKPWEVALWGGYRGNYEGTVPGHNGGCVDWPRRWCDNLSNNDPFVLTFVSKAVAAVTLELANHRFTRTP
jgi:hypothetical protein